MKDKYCLFTNDVETTSIKYNKLSDKTGEEVLKSCMPRLLNLYKKYNIKSTFFFTGHIAEKFPEIVKMVIPYGHEVGCHGYSHEVDKAFDLLNYDKQFYVLKKTKGILEDISGQEVISFRAPALRVNKFTVKALINSGFKIDSSTAAQRADMFFSFGSKNKLNWLIQPRVPYFTQNENIWKKGSSSLFEIPISAIGIPYIGTFLRISPLMTKWLHFLLNIENCINHKPIVFLIHPNELINESETDEPEGLIINKRTNKVFSYYIKDILRHKLKLRNLGNKACELYENEINYFLKKYYQFLTLSELYHKTNKYR